MDSLDGSLEGSLSTGSLSTGTGKSRAAAKVRPRMVGILRAPEKDYCALDTETVLLGFSGFMSAVKWNNASFVDGVAALGNRVVEAAEY